MTVNTAANRFIVSPLHAQFYQQLIGSSVGFHELGAKLVRYAEHCYIFRKVERAEETARLLINIPLRQYQLIGQYYLGWCEYVRGFDVKSAFEHIAEYAPLQYRARAMHTLAALAARGSDSVSELRWIVESMKVSPSLEGFRGMAIMKAREGFHNSSIKDLETCMPFARYADPLSYYDYLNSYAVELSEAGRLYEARNISRIVLASPFAPAYPEWRDTAEDLKPANRSFISVPLIEYRHVKARPPATETEKQKPASVVSFPPLKEAPPPQKPERLSPREINELTASQKRELILTAIRTSPALESDYDKMLVMVGLLKTGPTDKVLDLEDDALLDDMMVEWSNQIEPEELAAVLSALRDCDDSLRQRDIFDRMIRIAFEQTQLCGVTEEQWRLRFERRLPKK
jgi:hypothetical protein